MERLDASDIIDKLIDSKRSLIAEQAAREEAEDNEIAKRFFQNTATGERVRRIVDEDAVDNSSSNGGDDKHDEWERREHEYLKDMRRKILGVGEGEEVGHHWGGSGVGISKSSNTSDINSSRASSSASSVSITSAPLSANGLKRTVNHLGVVVSKKPKTGDSVVDATSVAAAAAKQMHQPKEESLSCLAGLGAYGSDSE